MRRLFALAVVALHALLILLLVSGQRLRPEPEQEVPSFVSIWITPVAPVVIEEPDVSVPTAEAEPPRLARKDEDSRSDSVEASGPEPSTASEPATTPRVDWLGEAALAARRSAAEPEKREVFSDPRRDR